MFPGWLLRKPVVNLSYIANYGYTDGPGDWHIWFRQNGEKVNESLGAVPEGVIRTKVEALL